MTWKSWNLINLIFIRISIQNNIHIFKNCMDVLRCTLVHSSKTLRYFQNHFGLYLKAKNSKELQHFFVLETFSL